MKIRHLLIVTLSLVLLACGQAPLSKEQQLHQDLAQMEALAEAKKTSDLMDYFDESFQPENGWSLKDIQRMLHFRFMKHKTVHITQVVKETEWLSDNEVKVAIAAALGGTPISDITAISEARAQLMKFDVVLERYDDHFKIKSVKWQHAYPTDFL